MVLDEMKGSLVEKLQAKLGLQVTGTYDRPLKLAIIGWQQSNGLAATGVCDEAMWVELFGSKPAPDAPAKSTTKFNPKAVDSDKDGFVQDGTIFERAVKLQDTKDEDKSQKA